MPISLCGSLHGWGKKTERADEPQKTRRTATHSKMRLRPVFIEENERRRIRADAPDWCPWPIAAYYHNHLNVKIFLSSIVADANRNTNKVDARY
jgi:hypothetical protein